MIQPLFRCVLPGSLLASAAIAQTFVVDAANGPGTNFTTIQAAVDAAPNGATIVVRAGAYPGFVAVGKGLGVLCDPGVTFAAQGGFPAIRVQQVPAHARFVLRGGSAGLGTQWSTITDCAGSVHVEETVAIDHTGSNCAQVMLRNCTGWNFSFSNADVVLEACTLRGWNAYTAPLGGPTYPARPALSLTSGQAQLVDCTLVGGDGTWWITTYPDAPGLLTSGSAVRVLGTTTIASGSGLVTGSPAIDGTGTLRVAPTVALTASAQPPIAPSIAATTAPMPAVRSWSAVSVRADGAHPVEVPPARGIFGACDEMQLEGAQRGARTWRRGMGPCSSARLRAGSA